MDNAIQGRVYPAYTTKQLREFIADGKGNPKMVAEVERREAVAAGDKSKMMPSERLRAAQS